MHPPDQKLWQVFQSLRVLHSQLPQYSVNLQLPWARRLLFTCLSKFSPAPKRYCRGASNYQNWMENKLSQMVPNRWSKRWVQLKYRWWKKSCTTWDLWNPINNGINYLSTAAGFQPSTVSSSIFRFGAVTFASTNINELSPNSASACACICSSGPTCCDIEGRILPSQVANHRAFDAEFIRGVRSSKTMNAINTPFKHLATQNSAWKILFSKTSSHWRGCLL